MYNSSEVQKIILTPSQLYRNIDEVYCSITSYLVKEQGCKEEYQDYVISLNQDNDLLARTNSIAKIERDFCIEIKNKKQVLTFDNIKFTQQPSCSQYLTINERALNDFMTINSNPGVLFNLV